MWGLYIYIIFNKLNQPLYGSLLNNLVEWNVIRVCFTLLIFHLRHPRNGRTFGFGHNSHFQKQQSEEPKREPKKTWKHNSRNGVGGVKTVKTRETLRVVTTLCLMFLFGLTSR